MKGSRGRGWGCGPVAGCHGRARMLGPAVPLMDHDPAAELLAARSGRAPGGSEADHGSSGREGHGPRAESSPPALRDGQGHVQGARTPGRARGVIEAAPGR